MDIPEFPESREIMISDKPEFDEAFRLMQPVNSEFTFTDLFLWGKARGYRVSRRNGHILVKNKMIGEGVFFSPVGPDAAGVIMDETEKNPDTVFVRIPEDVAVKVDGKRFDVLPQPEHFDYVYKRADLAELKGAKYYPKRSFAEKAMGYKPQVLVNSDLPVESCRQLQEEWCRKRLCADDKSLLEEDRALHELFRRKKELGVTCVGIMIDGQLAAFSVGEPLNRETFVVHFEKAEPKYRGIYQLINREFSRMVPESFGFINREEDMGIEGLRKAKESYHPAFMIRKFRVSAKA